MASLFLLNLSNKSIFRKKKLKEKYSTEYNQQLLSRYFLNLCFIYELFSKALKMQTTLVREKLTGMNGLRQQQSARVSEVALGGEGERRNCPPGNLLV